MDRNREARRSTMAASANGLPRRRHRSSSLRDSPEEDGPMELPETARLRDRGVKKDRDRERSDRDRDRDRSSRSKRRRGNREEGGDESSEESVNDEDEDDYEDEGGGVGGGVRMLPPLNPTVASAVSSSLLSNHQYVNRKSFPPSATAKVLRPAAAAGWKPADEMIGFSVPRKARSASVKRLQECSISGSGVGAEQINRQTSTSPVRPSPSPAPISPPSSSNASVRKKIKPNGSKPRPPKSASKPSSSNPEELEIEIAEVLYGMMTQSQNPSTREVTASDSAKFDPREMNKLSGDAKSRVSSPISNSSASPLPTVAAPKRKRPRQVSDNLGCSLSVRPNNPISSPKTEVPSPNMEKISDSAVAAAENGGVPQDSELPPPDSGRPETGRDVGPAKEEAVNSPKKESPVGRPDEDREVATGIRPNSTISEIESPKEEKFKIDLMAPPPQMRSPPGREGEGAFGVAVERKPVVESLKEEAIKAEPEPKRAKLMTEGDESEKPVVIKERNIDLQLDLETAEKSVILLNPQVQKLQQQKAAKDEPPHAEKIGQTSSLPLPMPVTSWPGGLPPMGYMAPLQGVVSMEGNTVSPTPIQPLFSHPRPKRCATHCYIARNIHYLQQFMKMNPFWPPAAGSASLFGAKPYNLSVVPSVELQGNVGRTANSVQEKGQGLSIFPGPSGKDKGSPANHIADAQRKQQILLQQALTPGAPPSNILHGPAFIFPLNQQQAAAAAASVRPGSVKSLTASGNVASTNASSSASVSGSTTAPPAATAVSFNYPNMPASETQYLAILQNNPYPFPIPSVGAPPNYRGTHAQAIPFFNGSFFSSQMIHPSQLQQQQQPSTQSPQVQQGHQNTSSGSSSSQKHLQSQQQRPQSSGTYPGNGSGNLHSFPAPKKANQHMANQHMPTSHQARHLETEVGGEDSPSTADSRVSRPSMSVYGQNFPVPIHPQNFAMMTPPPSALAAAASGGGNHGEKKQQQQQQQHHNHHQQHHHNGLKTAGVESLPHQTYAMSFASMNGITTAPGIDISNVAQNHAVLQSLPEATRHSYQIIAAAAAAHTAQQRKNFRVSEEGKTGGGCGDSSNADEEKKSLAGKAPLTGGQSIVFSRPDLTDSNAPATNVVDSSARNLNLVSAPPRSSRSSTPTVMAGTNASNSQLHAQLQLQQQQQQMMQFHRHQQQQQQQLVAAAAAARNKTQPTSNGSVYSEHLASSTPTSAAKFPNGLSSAFPQNLVQNSSSSPNQSPQWKNSLRTTSQVPSSLAPSTTSSMKNLPQQQTRTQQNHTQISFGSSQKSTAPQGQQAPTSHQAPSPPMMVGSPTTSSISKSAGGSPRMATSTSAANKSSAQPSTLSSQSPKNSTTVPNRKSSPVGGRNVPSVLGNSHITSSLNTSSKPQLQQQQQQQLFFSHAYMQAQAPHSAGANSGGSTTSGYFLQRRRSEQPQQSQQPPPQGSAATSSTGMLSLSSPVAVSNASTSDAKAVATAASAAAAASNMKGSGLSPQGILHSAQFTAQSSGNTHPLVPPGFSYVQVKPAEQKQPAGNRPDCLTRK